ncbi:hypothetical protein [Escherichia coli]|uniref:hypothetical protein n=1 Tax=Escherichia coli TaxID=562 RepID=UPI00295A3450|nr:hypothetical protein [Salmonella enterica]
MKKKSFAKAMIIGFIKVSISIFLLYILCIFIGSIYDYFGFYPHFLDLISDGGFSRNSYTGVFLMGFISLPFILIILFLIVVLFSLIVYVLLEIGGYYE